MSCIVHGAFLPRSTQANNPISNDKKPSIKNRGGRLFEVKNGIVSKEITGTSSKEINKISKICRFCIGGITEKSKEIKCNVKFLHITRTFDGNNNSNVEL